MRFYTCMYASIYYIAERITAHTYMKKKYIYIYRYARPPPVPTFWLILSDAGCGPWITSTPNLYLKIVILKAFLWVLGNGHFTSMFNYPGKRPQTVCVRSVSRKSRDPDAFQRGDGGDEVNVGVSECG